MKNLNKKKLTKSDKLKIIRIVIFAVVVIVIVIFSLKLFGFVNNLSNEAYRLDFKNKISDMGLLRSFASTWLANYSNSCSGYTRPTS